MLARHLTWLQAGEVLGKPRHLQRIRQCYQCPGISRRWIRGPTTAPLTDQAGIVELLVRLKHDVYADFSVRHFYEQVTEKHQVVSYNWMRLMLRETGVVEVEPARARCWRWRQRRPLVGMLLMSM